MEFAGFKSAFSMGDYVKVAVSSEIGEVIAIAFYATDETRYLVRYRAGDGRAVEAWWQESALVAVAA